ncbi:hypothetical protein TWF694_000314 [Orbilia ellipsospora]|uniref:Clr5 domain-containing protein n=1 Tax=Orbilia ellipsospora TaxID=2528407 RepID=A0AAV9XP45_9PEZI
MDAESSRLSITTIIEDPSATPTKRRKLAPRISEDRWQEYREQISDWYQSHTVSEVLELLKQRGLEASEDQLRKKLRDFGIKKYDLSKGKKRGFNNLQSGCCTSSPNI